MLALTALSAVACCGSAEEPLAIIPVPQETVRGEGHFEMPEVVTYATDLTGSERDDLRSWMSVCPVAFAEAGDAQSAVLTLSLGEGAAPESYRLEIAPARIAIAGGDAAGIFYGLQTLLQLRDQFGGRIPALTISDAPRFGYRGMMLDVSRHFRSKEFVKRQLDLMARYKLNRFHWHLTDGAGWRIEIKSHPQLTDFAAWRPYADWDGWNYGGKRYCHRDDPEARGGYYTQDDIREVVEYARLRHITVIPEIEMPGHSEEVLAVYPDLACSRQPYVNSDYCIGNEATFRFVEEVLSEVIELFPSKYIHIGGDEASKGGWRSCPRCRARMRSEGLKDVDELQSYMIRRVEKFLNAKGRDLIGWDEILEGGLAPNATVMSWRGVEGGIAAAEQGHHAVMTPSGYCYLDFCQDDPTREPPAAAAFLTLRRAYSYDPVPDTLPAHVKPMILGVQGTLGCEHAPTDEHAEHMLWPRMLAIAEVAWSPVANKDYDDFRLRALQTVRWMQEHGYHPFDLAQEVGPRPESLEPVQCLSTGKKVVYEPSYHAKYPAAGDGSLTDGLRGDWNYGDRRWQGWLDTDVRLTVDLESRRRIRRIAADFMQGFFADIWMPRAVRFLVSDDGTEFRQLGEVENDVPFEFRQDCYRTFAWEGADEARYVRIEALSNGHPGGWIFTDEFVVE